VEERRWSILPGSSPPPENVQLTCLQGPEPFTEQAHPWNELLLATDTRPEFPGFFASPEWLRIWAKHLGTQATFYTFVAQDEDRWLGVLPMMVVQTKLGRMQLPMLTLSSWPELDTFELPAVNQEVRQKLLDYALDFAAKEIKDWSLMTMREISQDGPTHLALQNYCVRKKLHLFEDQRAKTPIFDFAELDSAEILRNKKLRYRLKKARRLVSELGEMEGLFEIATPENYQRIMADCTEVERHSWKGQTQPDAGFLLTEPKRSFANELWQTLAERKAIGSGILRADGKPLTIHWGMIEEGRFLGYQMCFLQEHSRVSLGSVVLDDMLEACPGLGIHIFDASRGSTDGKHILHRYQCSMRYQMLTTFYRPTLKGRALRLMREVVAPTLSKLKKD
jgi:hypothetical protein